MEPLSTLKQLLRKKPTQEVWWDICLFLQGLSQSKSVPEAWRLAYPKLSKWSNSMVFPPQSFEGSTIELDRHLYISWSSANKGTFKVFDIDNSSRGEFKHRYLGEILLNCEAGPPQLTLHYKSQEVYYYRDCGNPNCEAPDYVISVFGNRFSHCKRKDCFQPEIPAGWRGRPYQKTIQVKLLPNEEEEGYWFIDDDEFGFLSQED